MKRIILAAVAAATLLGAAPAAMAQPGYWHHRYWHHHFYGPRWRHPYFGHRRFCYHHPYRC